jgi:excisionase family DNA binding protein
MSRHHTERPPIVPTRVYSRAEVAEILNVSLSTVKRLLASGQLRASQPPGLRRVFITGQAILDMLEANEADTGPSRENSAGEVDEHDRV